MVRADIISSTKRGRNLTPAYLVQSVHNVLGGIDLDPASDSVANEEIQATRFYSLEEDGFSQPWKAKMLFLNPPGKTYSKGKMVKGAHWFDKLYKHWADGDIDSAIYVCYRGGSIGGVPFPMLNNSVICLTCKGAPEAGKGKKISGSGRIGFETVNSENTRVMADKNTQSSLIGLLSWSKGTKNLFREEFKQYGAIFNPYI